MINISSGTFLLYTVLLLTLPLPWIIAAFSAALFHELCHIACAVLSGATVERFRVTPYGASIHAIFSGTVQELLCALAGPAGSLSLVLFARHFPRLAICGVIQGLFNLLPLFPLDGGRIIRCLAYILFPSCAHQILKHLEPLFFALFLLVLLIFSVQLSVPAFLFAIPFLKRPCKPLQIKVQ